MSMSRRRGSRWLLTPARQMSMAPALEEHLLLSLERRYLDIVDVSRLELVETDPSAVFDPRADLRLARVRELVHEGEANWGMHLDHFRNVIAAARDDSTRLVSLLIGDPGGARLYFGMARRVEPLWSADDDGDARARRADLDLTARVLMEGIRANYLRVNASWLDGRTVWSEVLQPLHELRGDCLALTGIPSLRPSAGEDVFAQGLDRFIDGMRGRRYALIALADPVPLSRIDEMTERLWSLGSEIHSFVKTTIQQSRQRGHSLNSNIFGMQGVVDSLAESIGESSTDSQGATRMGEGGAMMAMGAAMGTLLGTLVFPGIGSMIGGALGSGLAASSAYGSGAAMSTMVGTAHSFTRSVTNASGRQSGSGMAGGYAFNWGRGLAVTQETLNKKAEYCESLCDRYIERLRDGRGAGLWSVGLYLLGEPHDVRLGAGLLRSRLAGDETHWEPIRSLALGESARDRFVLDFANPCYNLFAHGQEEEELRESYELGAALLKWGQGRASKVREFLRSLVDKTEDQRMRDLEAVRRLRQPLDPGESEFRRLWDDVRGLSLGHPLGRIMGGVATPMTTQELAIVLGPPRREVSGVAVRAGAAFGADAPSLADGPDRIDLGLVVHKAHDPDDDPGAVPFTIAPNDLCRHAFLCGITGSGKTHSCLRLLESLNVPVLIIEPAKGEYRRLLRARPHLRVFTVGDETVSPFRLNPFAFERGFPALRHIDHLKAVFNAAFPMYAAMPYLLEEALVEAYLDRGWNLADSTNAHIDAATEDASDYFPTLADLHDKIDEVVRRQGYSGPLRMDFSAALRARIGSLSRGAKGLGLGARRSTPMDWLLSRDVVLELRGLGDDDEKAFVMGLILMRLHEHREQEAARGEIGAGIAPLRHLTVIEEAHRLLKREPETSNPETAQPRAKAVETFVNLLSEVRASGEGILIIDQTPGKLAPEAIKSTNLKIVHKTLAADDRELVGAAMGLLPDQTRELAFLKRGYAAIHSEDRDQALCVKVRRGLDLGGPIPNDELTAAMSVLRQELAETFEDAPGLNSRPGWPRAFAKLGARPFDETVYQGVMGMAAGLLICRGNDAQAIARASWSAALNAAQASGGDENWAAASWLWHLDRYFRNLHRSSVRRLGILVPAQAILAQGWLDWAERGADDSALERYARCFASMRRPFAWLSGRYASTIAPRFVAIAPDDRSQLTTAIVDRLAGLARDRLTGLLGARLPEPLLTLTASLLLDAVADHSNDREPVLRIVASLITPHGAFGSGS